MGSRPERNLNSIARHKHKPMSGISGAFLPMTANNEAPSLGEIRAISVLFCTYFRMNYMGYLVSRLRVNESETNPCQGVLWHNFLQYYPH